MKKSPCAIAVATAMIAPALAGPGATPPVGVSASLDPTGIIATIDVNGPIRTDGAFFQSLGTNGRSCASCHVGSQAFGLSAAGARDRFALTHGQDPLFAAVDGANCSNAPQGGPRGDRLIPQRGLIRTPLALPVPAEFTISVVHDPYGCALQPDPATGETLVSVYRRPLP